ncbi:hypothetical protein BAE44_0000354 [Dichanthelium oligosanthes]|uniref:PB1-like domain-containing protein n=1 Tax=Dichanthelium oligosanthes TaxID=888268 RepID=A0A1E5WMJ7_9POAL|nr:hypothetical protein BAE44_0000354 [Dichanthelium oligosanthes]
MAGRLRAEAEPPPMYGADSTDFIVKVHHGGFFCGIGQNHAYLNEKVSLFDDCKADFWSFLGIEEITLRLDYGMGGPSLRVHWPLLGKDLSDELRIITSDEETLVMKQVANRVKTFVLYYDHYNHVANNTGKT